MTLALIAISFLGSIAFSLFLRKLDRPAHQLTQIKRIGELQIEQLEKTATAHVQSMKDASLEFEMLFHQSRQTLDRLREEVDGFETRLESLQEDRSRIDNLSGQL
ncbi:MAG: hypothetical protein KDK37_19470, partial [Leptospiraceae bacterium]|nr:hypothetical protein [Leptospiraceae bacterium]